LHTRETEVKNISFKLSNQKIKQTPSQYPIIATQ